jgi:hypothetical protein
MMMISAVDVWTFLHILLFVYWLGADLGVFIAAQAAKRGTLTYPQRSIALQLALKVDIAPRLSFALMFPCGLELAAARGLLEPAGWQRALAWLVAAAWVSFVVGMMRFEGRPAAAFCKHANEILHFVLFVAFALLGLASVAGYGPFPPGWLGWKVLLFAMIFFCGIMIDRRFAPMAPAFAQLATTGSTPALERTITRAVDEAVHWVLALYALVVVIAFLGTARPF